KENHRQGGRGPAQECGRAATPEERLAGPRAKGTGKPASLARLEQNGSHQGQADHDVNRGYESNDKPGHPERLRSSTFVPADAQRSMRLARRSIHRGWAAFRLEQRLTDTEKRFGPERCPADQEPVHL